MLASMMKAKYLTKKFGYTISRTAIQSMVETFCRRVQEVTLQHCLACRMLHAVVLCLKPNDIDDLVQCHLQPVRACGGPINSKLTIACIATAIGICQARAPLLLHENGGHSSLTKTWAESI